ncbi:MAG: hypothetical protein WBP93_09075 [Pyrinomonadaceae bacterium]
MHTPIRWRLGILAAVAIALLAIFPQLNLWRLRGSDWNGSFAGYRGEDEYAYCSYVKALMDGRPRRNDPYTGLDEQNGEPLPESILSIQMVPAYAIAIPARLFGISASNAFIALTLLAAIAASLAIFRILAEVTGNDPLAATGALLVLCVGSLYPLQIAIRCIQNLMDPTIELHGDYVLLGFMRRYVPAAPFPLYFVFCLLVWHALAAHEKRSSALMPAIAAGAVFALLVFSHFYLWTAAAAWLACLALLWCVGRPEGWKRALKSLGIIGASCVAALVPYFILLRHRAPNMDKVEALTLSHAPDLMRASELVGLMVLALLAFGVRRKLIAWNDPTILFAASFALMPFAVFNQAVLTGRSLQPFHYDGYIANYAVLLGGIIALAHLWHGRAQREPAWVWPRLLLCVALMAFGWGIFELKVSYGSQIGSTIVRDEEWAVALQMAKTARLSSSVEQSARPVVMTDNLRLADLLPIVAPQALLWSPRMNIFSGATAHENEERYFQFLYYTGVDEPTFKKLADDNRSLHLEVLFGIGRAHRAQGSKLQPVMPEEILQVSRKYSLYIASFNREQAAHPALSYVVTLTRSTTSFSNLDRWYERDAGERIGKFTLYRVKLRP